MSKSLKTTCLIKLEWTFLQWNQKTIKKLKKPPALEFQTFRRQTNRQSNQQKKLKKAQQEEIEMHQTATTKRSLSGSCHCQLFRAESQSLLISFLPFSCSLAQKEETPVAYKLLHVIATCIVWDAGFLTEKGIYADFRKVNIVLLSNSLQRYCKLMYGQFRS